MVQTSEEDEALAQYDNFMLWSTIIGGIVIVAAYFTLLYVLGRAAVGQ